MSTRVILGYAASIVLLFGSLGCDKDADAGVRDKPRHQITSAKGVAKAPVRTAKPSAEAAMAEAKKIFKSRCAVCHGTSGKGDGAAAKSLKPKPRNYADKTWQSQVTDEQIRKAIVLGGPSIGKSPLMPGNVDLRNKPEVVSGLLKIIRGFATN